MIALGQSIGWGILGTGNIANLFAQDLAHIEGARLVAVGSRSQERAETFGNRFDIHHRHGSYERFAENPEIDVVYIASPHSEHRAHAIRCLEAGKHVLCEKPFALNAKQAEEMISSARSNKRFLMEAMWAHFLPAMVELRKLLADGVIGDILELSADLGFVSTYNPESRLYNSALGGGALLDMGVYAVALATMILDKPLEIKSQAKFSPSHVDTETRMTFKYASGVTANLFCSITENTNREVVIKGKKGQIKITAPWWHAPKLIVSIDGQTDQIIAPPVVGTGLNYQAAHVMDCLRKGLLESDEMTFERTLMNMRLLDQIRGQIRLSYPDE